MITLDEHYFYMDKITEYISDNINFLLNKEFTIDFDYNIKIIKNNLRPPINMMLFNPDLDKVYFPAFKSESEITDYIFKINGIINKYILYLDDIETREDKIKFINDNNV